jgi:hypothetical protein
MDAYKIPNFNIKDYHSRFISKGMLKEYSILSRLTKKQRVEIFNLAFSGKLSDLNNYYPNNEESEILDKFFQMYNDYIKVIEKIKSL